MALSDQELADLLTSGAERTDVEFKGPGKSTDKAFFAKIILAVLAMTNRRDGGVVLIGVQEQRGTPALVRGLDDESLETWTSDDVRDRLAVFADPSVDVQVEHRSVDGKVIVLIIVREFADVPVICRKDGDGLREGAIYVRSRRKPESVELPRQAEMRDLLELATQKRLRAFLETATAAGLIGAGASPLAAAPSDDEQYARQHSGLDSAIAQKARSHGYWTVSISPASFVERRVESVTDLYPIMERAAVEYRGWPYPSVLPGESPDIGADFIDFEVDSRIHVDAWRLYQSGLFCQVMALWEDWYTADFLFKGTGRAGPPVGKTLGVDLAIGTLTELFEFASRLALSAAGGDAMSIQVGVHGLQGRELMLPSNRASFSTPKIATLPSFDFPPLVVATTTLVATARELAAEWARELFRRFGWDASLETIRSMQPRPGTG